MTEYLILLLIFEPVLEATVKPVGEIHLGQGVGERVVGVLAQLLKDGAVMEAVVEHLVDAQAERLGQAGDFAVAGALFPAEKVREISEPGGGAVAASDSLPALFLPGLLEESEGGEGGGGAADGWVGGFMDWWIGGPAAASLWRGKLMD